MKAVASSVLTHEAIIDAAWPGKIEPSLRSAFPQVTEDQLRVAHGFAYGGAILQDLGYYPHGNKRFSDLTHYVLSATFVLALLHEARDVNETAFALGALSHYASDMNVHRIATNPGEAILYPRLRRRFGPVITYEQDPAAHLKTEFGFDVLEVAKGNFAPEAYHRLIGFGVSTDLLARAFQTTYGFSLSELFPDLDRSIGSFRRAVSHTIPAATRIAWAERAREIRKAQPSVTRSRFIYVMSRSSYEREWGKRYDRPTARDRMAAFLLKLVPPIGPLRVLRFKMPTPEVEQLFMQSFEKSVAVYGRQVEQGSALDLPNINFDTGEITGQGIYKLQDKTYAFWQRELAAQRQLAAAAVVGKQAGPVVAVE